MYNFWQHLPEYLNPIAFSIGGFSVFWYSLMWLVAFAVCYVALVYRIKKGEGTYDVELIQDVMVNALFGALIGGRLGYVIFYDLPYYVAHPLSVVSPYDFSLGEWVGIYGMSYHGGLIGVVLVIFYTAYKKKVHAMQLCDFIVPVVPLGYMFGRLGNFFNQELVGRITTSPIGMYFNGETVLRHPSQLYEAFFEGVILFIILWQMRNKRFSIGVMSMIYLMLYSAFRFVIEFYRAPDAQLGFVVGNLTMGQVLSVCVIVTSAGFLVYHRLYHDQNVA
ncbi:MAG: prolipoprotein diacylglyceryl transferase [Parcubacteria group bacterium]|jgi:phosphatidylglycerol:prolipoprotein diacylglycerol transferase